MLIHIFKFEWLALIKNRLFLGVFCFSMILCFLALWSGLINYQKQIQVVHEVKSSEDAYYQKLEDRLADVEKSGSQGNQFNNPADPTRLAFGIGTKYVYREPHFMQILNSGQSDLHPYYFKVTASKHQNLFHHSEIKNGSLSFVGTYDLTFVIIYLLPLLIIAFSFDMLSDERENGTLPYLYSSGWPPSKLLLGRFLFRGLILYGSVWGLSVLFLIFSTQGLGFLGATQFWIWGLLVLLYLGFWFSLSFFINSLGRAANYNAAVLVFSWLAVVVLMPGLLQYVTESTYPVPSRSILITETRDAGVEAQKRASEVLNQYVEEHPELASNKETLNMNDFGTRYFTVLSDIEASVAPTTNTFEQRQKDRDSFIKNFSVLSPALLVQEMMNEISATGNHHYRHLEQDALALKKKLRDFYLNMMFFGKQLKSTEIVQIPVFNLSEVYYRIDYRWVIRKMAFILGLNALLLTFALRKFKMNTYADYNRSLVG